MKYTALVLVWLSTFIGIANQTMQKSSGPEFTITELLVGLLIIPALVVCSIALIIGIVGFIFVPDQRRFFALLSVVSIIAPALNFL